MLLYCGVKRVVEAFDRGERSIKVDERKNRYNRHGDVFNLLENLYIWKYLRQILLHRIGTSLNILDFNGAECRVQFRRLGNTMTSP